MSSKFIRIVGQAQLMHAWLEILEEGWTTSPRRKVPANAGRLAPSASRSSVRRGTAREQRFR